MQARESRLERVLEGRKQFLVPPWRVSLAATPTPSCSCCGAVARGERECRWHARHTDSAGVSPAPARSHAGGCCGALDIPGHVEVVGWLDTQVTTLERRLDKALGLLVDGELCALQTEFELCLRPKRMDGRVSTYQALFHMGRSVEAPDASRPPIESLVVMLSGRAKPWPRERKIRIGWRKTRRRSVDAA